MSDQDTTPVADQPVSQEAGAPATIGTPDPAEATAVGEDQGGMPDITSAATIDAGEGGEERTRGRAQEHRVVTLNITVHFVKPEEAWSGPATGARHRQSS